MGGVSKDSLTQQATDRPPHPSSGEVYLSWVCSTP